ncbi:MAG TPA: hypothetical protein VIV12_31050, partial [Streptosporangiaceae bacterium]
TIGHHPPIVASQESPRTQAKFVTSGRARRLAEFAAEDAPAEEPSPALGRLNVENGQLCRGR